MNLIVNIHRNLSDMTTLLRRTMAGPLRSSRSRKIHNVFQRIRLRFFGFCGRPSAHLSFVSWRMAMSDRLLARRIHDGSWRHRPSARSSWIVSLKRRHRHSHSVPRFTNDDRWRMQQRMVIAAEAFMNHAGPGTCVAGWGKLLWHGGKWMVPTARTTGISC